MDHFPNDFALDMARTVDLFCEESPQVLQKLLQAAVAADNEEAEYECEMRFKQFDALQRFQQLATVGSYDDSILAYHGIELSEQQESILKVIHKSTPIWVQGKMADILIRKMGETNTDGRTMSQIAEVLLDAIKTEGGMSPQTVGKAKSLVIKLANQKQ